MVLFQRIEIDLEAERERIKNVFTGRIRKSLNKLVDLFEKGEFQACLDLIHNPRAFKYNENAECHEIEHIGREIGKILRTINYGEWYTREQIIKDAKAFLDKQSKA